MDSSRIVKLLEILQVKQIRVTSGWVTASCPLAPWRHKSGKDTNPSFGVVINGNNRSVYSCFACGTGSLEELVQSIEMYSQGINHSYNFAMAHVLLEEDKDLISLPEYGEVQLNAQVFQELPQYWLGSFLPAANYPISYDYLLGRGLTPLDIWDFCIKYDTKRSMVVFPYYTVWGKFAGARGRSILSDVEGPKKHFDYSFQGSNNARLVWYGEQRLNLSGPVVVVEGQFDWMRTKEAYPKVVANLTAKPSWDKMKKLADSGTVIQIPDRDEAGEQSIKVYASMCSRLGLKHRVIRLDDGAKDPGECLVDYLRDKIQEVL